MICIDDRGDPADAVKRCPSLLGDAEEHNLIAHLEIMPEPGHLDWVSFVNSNK